MIHWGWLIAAFIAGIISGAVALITIACCVIAKAADEEEQAMTDSFA